MKAGSNAELAINLSDIQAMTHLALYGAAKLRAAVLIEQNQSSEARSHLIAATMQWKQYADIMDAHYIGADMQRNFHFKSWHQLDPKVQSDLTNAGGPISVDFEKPYPWVRIATPLDLAEVKTPADISIIVNAAAEKGSSLKVELLDNGKSIHSSTEGTFKHKLSLNPGDHTLTARVTDAAGASKEHTIHIAAFDDQTQNSLPWIETFTLADQTKRDEARTTWTAERSKGIFEVRDNALFINDKGEEATLRTGEITLNKQPVTISLDITPQGTDDRDYVRVYQIVDSGKEQLIGEVKGKNKPTTLTGTATGSKLTLLIRTKVSSEDEVFIMDNLKVTQE